jgi:hypothetical protein
MSSKQNQNATGIAPTDRESHIMEEPDELNELERLAGINLKQE